ncbi:hypothetical protein BRSPCE3_61570 [Bradyrhizobium sp. Ce-3]|nr:hypothetical protein BRSPCE3_61570 [Bradyrhizobium sp. Ce-3]
MPLVIPGLAKREPGIHSSTEPAARRIPGSRFTGPGMTVERKPYAWSSPYSVCSVRTASSV